MAEAHLIDDDPLTEIDPRTLARWLAEDRAVVVDVREQVEWDHERLPGSIHMVPLSEFDAAAMPDVGDRTPVLICKAGVRSATAGDVLIDAGWPEVIHLAGGITDWKNAGLPVER